MVTRFADLSKPARVLARPIGEPAMVTSMIYRGDLQCCPVLATLCERLKRPLGAPIGVCRFSSGLRVALAFCGLVVQLAGSRPFRDALVAGTSAGTVQNRPQQMPRIYLISPGGLINNARAQPEGSAASSIPGNSSTAKGDNNHSDGSGSDIPASRTSGLGRAVLRRWSPRRQAHPTRC